MSEEKVSVGARTQERILKNALQHFCNFGYNGTSVREITAASEVTKPTLYYYFKNKEELFTKLAESCFQLVLNRIDAALDNQENFEQALNALFQSMDEVVSENSSALKFIHSLVVAPQRGTPEVGAKRFMEQIESHLDRIMKKAVHQGECLEDKRETMRVVFAALLGFYTKSVLTSATDNFPSKKTFSSIIQSVAFCAANASCSAPMPRA